MKKITKSVVAMPNKIYNAVVFLRRKPKFARCKPRINGRIYIVSDKNAVSFGDGVRINSSMKSDPIGGSTRTILFAEPGAKIVIGNNVGISNTAIHAAKLITIGNNVLIGGDCKIYDTDFHSIVYEERIRNVGENIVPVVIGDGAFLGAGCMILKGVNIGRQSIIGAGSVVTKDVPEKQMWGGVPARFIKEL